ncbi:MAG: hypothetical protein KJ548_13995 [Actinobacteria bacterium]|nr:hypothetical protein [Actinomycetota bacterium]MCG2800834.1 hypothetical protein [Cellulomonas sp.]
MSRTAVIAVAAAVVLLGTAQIATKPNRVPDVSYVTLEDGTLARMPMMTTLVQPGHSRRPAPLGMTLAEAFGSMAATEQTTSYAYTVGRGITIGDRGDPPGPYVLVVISPSGQVLSTCEQTIAGWFPPCLLDGVAQVK